MNVALSFLKCLLFCFLFFFKCINLFVFFQLAEKQNQSSDQSGATTHVSVSQPAAPVSTSDCVKPVAFNKEMNSTSPQRLGDRTDSEPAGKPVEQESEQDPLICQQLGDMEVVPVEAMGMPAKQSQPPGVAQTKSSCDDEEKRDQSKEEPLLEMKQLDG